MRFFSTRSRDDGVALADAMACGLAPDGGLYIPGSLPRFEADESSSGASLAEIASLVLEPFFAGDVLEPGLQEIAAEAFNFPAPLTPLRGGREPLEVLELFHGPTAAFKDFGARFLAQSLSRLQATGRTATILVATSGDTGSAVAAAFHRRAGFEVVILFPHGRVSPRQEQQLACWGDNVRSFAVHGSFDDCQRLAKAAFADPEIRRARELSSANSINIGRLLPQIVYYAAASLDVARRTEGPASFIVPSGNLGNAVACVWAREMGLPIAEIVLAHNANRTVPDFVESGTWSPRPSVATLASAMDVGDPSNMERLRALLPDADHWERLAAVSISDEQIRARIRSDYSGYGRVWCPHTAVGAEAYMQLPVELRREHHWVLVATAHPAKFSEIVEPLIGSEVAVPAPLAALLALPRQVNEIEAEFATLKEKLLQR
ncbi:MAG TPA: threonine synthase [Steroidobacteraceae bacterium]|nr:threonine synthase [Steroidobacteraceae bacterium]